MPSVDCNEPWLTECACGITESDKPVNCLAFIVSSGPPPIEWRVTEPNIAAPTVARVREFTLRVISREDLLLDYER